MEQETAKEVYITTYIDLNTILVSTVLKYLLQNKTTKQNIIFASAAYEANDELVDPKTEITPALLHEMEENLIQPRYFKSRAEQANRTRKNGKVFSSLWICNN